MRNKYLIRKTMAGEARGVRRQECRRYAGNAGHKKMRSRYSGTAGWKTR
jgi:hypothetical protein